MSVFEPATFYPVECVNGPVMVDSQESPPSVSELRSLGLWVRLEDYRAAVDRRSDPSREAMREALEPFAAIPVERFKGGNGPGGDPEDVFHAWNLGETEVELKVKHVLAARAALALADGGKP